MYMCIYIYRYTYEGRRSGSGLLDLLHADGLVGQDLSVFTSRVRKRFYEYTYDYTIKLYHVLVKQQHNMCYYIYIYMYTYITASG